MKPPSKKKELHPLDIAVKGNKIKNMTEDPLCITNSESGMNVVYPPDSDGICGPLLFVNTSPYFPSPNGKNIYPLSFKLLLPEKK